MKSNIEHGNANVDGQDYRHWLLGKFVKDRESLKYSEDLEIKWANLKKGDKRDSWVTSKVAHSICILISGGIEIIFPDKTRLLSKQGDYVIWGPGVPHNWKVTEDCVALTIRWPSEPEDSIDIDNPSKS